MGAGSVTLVGTPSAFTSGVDGSHVAGIRFVTVPDHAASGTKIDIDMTISRKITMWCYATSNNSLPGGSSIGLNYGVVSISVTDSTATTAIAGANHAMIFRDPSNTWIPANSGGVVPSGADCKAEFSWGIATTSASNNYSQDETLTVNGLGDKIDANAACLLMSGVAVGAHYPNAAYNPGAQAYAKADKPVITINTARQLP